MPKRSSRKAAPRDAGSAALLRIARAIATLDLREVVEQAARLGAEALGADRAVIYLVSDDHLEVVAGSGAEPQRGRWPLAVIGPYTRQIIDQRRPIYVPSVESPDQSDGLWFLSFVGAPIRVGDELLGCIQIGATRRRRTFTASERRLVIGIADQVAVAVRNARLAEENRRRLAELEDLSRRIWKAQEDERRRISRELHDEAGQALVALKMKLALLRSVSNAAVVDEIASLASEVLENLRRISYDLRPRSLDELGLAAVIRSLTESLRKSSALEVALRMTPLSLDAEQESIAFRFVQEALTNVVRHARATRVEVHADRSETSARIEVRDDGVGFSPASVKLGLGLAGMRERASLAGGSVTIRSSPGRGTSLVLVLPASRRTAVA